MAKIQRIATGPVTPLADPIAPDKVLRGAPVTGVRAASEDEARGFYTGVWESAPGAWRVDYTEEELCVIVAGRCRLVAEDGTAENFGPGDAFVIPRGFKGTWETLEQVRKVYAILT